MLRGVGCVRRMEGPEGCEARSEANPGMCRPRRGNAQILLIFHFFLSLHIKIPQNMLGTQIIFKTNMAFELYLTFNF